MNMVDVIVKKRDGGTLSDEDIRYVVEEYVKGDIPDYQVSAWLMAVFFQGMDKDETVSLTRSMMKSGDRMDLSAVKGHVVDKHSTGGVGDTTTLVLAPWLAACGVPVAKMSGRGLGHTGGTIDKMESIPGFRTQMTMEEFISNANRIGVALAGQTGSIAPADKKIYALRDVTGTVEQQALIASSIMSKKLASGAGSILLDVKVGSGAFMKTLDEAVSLAKTMVDIGTSMGRNTKAVLSSMEQPLGNAIGNAIEVMEAVKVLRGEEKGDLYELCLVLAREMITMADEAISSAQAQERLIKALETGDAYRKFLEFVEAQGGNTKDLEEGLHLGKHEGKLLAVKDGYIRKLDAAVVGLSAMHLGAGRQTKEDPIDMGAGIRLCRRMGDFVKEGEVLAHAYTETRSKLEPALRSLESAFVIGDEEPKIQPLLLGMVDRTGVELGHETDNGAQGS